MHIEPSKKAAWTAALRSGEYLQGRGMLRGEYAEGEIYYCCLGVWCDIDPATRWGAHDYAVDQHGDASVSILPYGTAVGLFQSVDDDLINNPAVPGLLARNRYEGEGDVQVNLAELNDAGMTFEQIADIIDYFF